MGKRDYSKQICQLVFLSFQIINQFAVKGGKFIILDLNVTQNQFVTSVNSLYSELAKFFIAVKKLQGFVMNLAGHSIKLRFIRDYPCLY